MKYILILFLFGCHTPKSDLPDEVLVFEAVDTGWTKQGQLPEPSDKCREELEGFNIAFPTSLSEYGVFCPLDAYACFVWRLTKHPNQELYSVRYAEAVIRPDTYSHEHYMHLASHELLHGYVSCTLNRWPDLYDHSHTDRRVWENKYSISAESIAESILDSR